MRLRLLIIVVSLLFLVLLAPVAAVAQNASAPKGAAASKSASALRTPDGQPDLQGIWSLATITPLERPADLSGKEFFTEKEAADYEAEVRKRNNMDRRDGPPEADVSRAYNDFWWDRGTRVVETRRTSLIVDPKDGKIPSLMPAARERQAERAAANRGREFDGPENRPLAERCIIWPSTGPPMLPTAYNNNIQIVQSPEHVVILIEMIHDARVVPLDGRPHLAQGIRQWKGDSRGRWEGDTLVVETTNFTNRTAFRGASETMRLTERFRRVDADTLLYRFTVTDPAAFDKPWTAEIPLSKSDAPMFEYACHEGNYAMVGGLAGARAEEKRAAQGK
jgi:hypothetical protein